MERAIARGGFGRGARRGGLTRAAVSGVGGAASAAADAIERTKPWRLHLVVLLLAVVAIRLHEAVPGLSLIRPALLLGTAGFVALWSSSTKGHRDAVLQDSSVRWVVVYAAWAAFTVPFALWPGQAAATVRGMVPSILLVAAILLLRPTERTIVRVFTGFVVASGAYAIALLTVGVSAGSGRTMLPSGSLDSNDVAVIMGMTFPLALGLTSRATGSRRILCLVMAGILVTAATATGSRGGTIAFLVGAVTFVVGQRGGRKFVFLVLLVVGGVFAWFNASPGYRTRMTLLFEGEKDYNYYAYSGRKQIWQRARIYTIQHPIVGVGVGNFPIAEGGYLDLHGARGKWSNAHNAYLQASAELGFPGAIIFIGMLVATGLRAAKYWRPGGRGGTYHRPELLAAVLAYATGSYFLSTAYFYSWFALVGLVALSDRVSIAPGVMSPGDSPAMSGRRSPQAVRGPAPTRGSAPAALILPGRPN